MAGVNASAGGCFAYAAVSTHCGGVTVTRPGAVSLVLVMPPTISEYRTYLQSRGLAPLTVKERVKFARGRWNEWGTWEVTGADLSAWLGRHEGWTRLTYHNHLRSLFSWLQEAGHIEDDPMRGVRRPPKPRPSPSPLTEVELRVALAAADPTVRTYLMLGYLAGLRAFEIAKFHGRDITAAGIYVMGKGGQGATVPTHPLLWELAGRYPRDGYWFPSPVEGRPHVGAASVTQRIRRHFQQLGISGATHRARHTYGTTLLRNGANLRIVQDLMRHASLSTTAVYLGVDEDERRNAISGLAA